MVKMAIVDIIGTTQYVRLPKHSFVDIPAKIDTGADDSAIWASEINEADGLLSFKLFAPASVFYSGEIYSTSDYQVAIVKNSFGKREYRYKVKLALEIADKLYDVSFNLADRSQNRYPILLGKRFLKNRFLVDVSKKNVAGGQATPNKPIIIITSRFDDDTKAFFKLIAKQAESEIITERYRNLHYEINENGKPIITLPDGRDIAEAKVIYFKSHMLFPEHAATLAQYLKYKHVAFVDREVGDFVSRSKLSELFILATNSIPVPQTLVITGRADVPTYTKLRAIFGDNFVVKDIYGNRGKNNFIIKNQKSYDEAWSRLIGVDTVLVQRYIENEGFLRVLLMGQQVVQVIKRSATSHQDPLKAHLNKPYGGANAVELSVKEYDSLAIKLARKASLVTRRSIVGVDLIQDKISNKWYVLEANYNPEVVRGIDIPKRAKGLTRFLESDNK